MVALAAVFWAVVGAAISIGFLAACAIGCARLDVWMAGHRRRAELRRHGR